MHAFHVGAAPQGPPEVLTAGSVIGNRFEIVGLAAIGGMGFIYRARDRLNGAQVALKLLQLGPDAGVERERGHREAALLAGLRHPAIVRYVAHGETPDRQLFLAMEWIDGPSLAERLDAGALTVVDSVEIAAQLSTALAVMHERGIVHRDVKPSNVMLRGGHAGEATLLDLGIARRAATLRALTRTGRAIGTPGYMAPERARGGHELSAAADVFSLGCVLYECLTGRPPFAADHVPAVLIRILLEDPQPIEELRPGLPPALVALVARMLAKQPNDRPQDAAELSAELRALAAALPDEGAAPPQLTAPPPRALTDSEQILFCVVIASARTQEESDAPHFRASVSRLVRSMGARGEWLADGSLVVAITGGESASDQVALAARCALAIKAHWPRAEVALATGRAELRDRLPLGEAIGRVTRLLGLHTDPGNRLPTEESDTFGVWLDTLSARLLPTRFSRVDLPQGILLHGEDAVGDETRPLLGRPTPCVGREQELALLRSFWERSVAEPAAGAVLVVAPPGVGKSRLRHEFVRRLETEGAPFTLLLGRGDPLSAGSPYDLLGQALRRHGEIRSEATLEARREMLDRRLGARLPTGIRLQVVEFLGELCGVPFPDEQRPPLRAARNDPRLMKDQIQQAFLDWLVAECAAQPLLVVLEDLHWADALSVQLVEVALRELSELPLLVVALARPEVADLYPRLWAGRVQEMSLGGLGRRACESLIQQVLSDRPPPRERIARLIEQAEGNALYLEELIRTEAEGDHAEIPETVLAMLQVRLGRLDPGARLVLRAASVFGETFWSGGVGALCPQIREAGDIEPLLDNLVAAEVIRRHRESRLAGEIQYGFRHALVRDAAYGLLTEADRALGHCLASDYFERAGEQDAMVVAEHARRGGASERAIPFYMRAAEQSFERGDLGAVLDRAARGVDCGARGEMLGVLRTLECVACFWRAEWARADAAGCEALDLLPRGSLWWCRAIQDLFVIVPNMNQVERMRALLHLFGEAEPSLDALVPYIAACSYLVTMTSLMGERTQAERFLRLLLRAAAEDERDLLVGGHRCFGHGWYIRALGVEPQRTLALAEQSVQDFTAAQDLRNLVHPQILLGLAQADMGMDADGEATLRDGLKVSQTLQDPFMIASVQMHLASVLAKGDDPERWREASKLAAAVVEADVSLVYSGISRGVRAEVLRREHQLPAARTEAEAARSMLGSTPVYVPDVLVTLIEVALAEGATSTALALVEEGRALLDSLGGPTWGEVPLRVAIAQACRSIGDIEGARASVRDALSGIAARAEGITDAARLKRFLQGRAEHPKARALAQEMGSEAAAP
jgi:hypothetical protein